MFSETRKEETVGRLAKLDVGGAGTGVAVGKPAKCAGPSSWMGLESHGGLKQESDRARSALRGGGSGCSREWGVVDRQGNLERGGHFRLHPRSSLIGSELLPGPPRIPYTTLWIKSF